MIRAADEALSAHHCAFVKTANTLWVIDLLSATWTRVNGEVVRAARLKDGDLVRVGGMSVVVRAGADGHPSDLPGTSAVVALTPVPAYPAAAPAHPGPPLGSTRPGRIGFVGAVRSGGRMPVLSSTHRFNPLVRQPCRGGPIALADRHDLAAELGLILRLRIQPVPAPVRLQLGRLLKTARRGGRRSSGR